MSHIFGIFFVLLLICRVDIKRVVIFVFFFFYNIEEILFLYINYHEYNK